MPSRRVKTFYKELGHRTHREHRSRKGRKQGWKINEERMFKLKKQKDAKRLKRYEPEH